MNQRDVSDPRPTLADRLRGLIADLAALGVAQEWAAWYGTHGDPHVVEVGRGMFGHIASARVDVIGVLAECSTAPADYGRALAEYIAAVDPATILGIIDPPAIDVEALRPWSFIADGDLDYANHEDHRYGVKIGTDHYWCAGCLARTPREFTSDGHGGWPNLVSAPNGMRVVMRHDPPRMTRRPLCPLREFGVIDGTTR